MKIKRIEKNTKIQFRCEGINMYLWRALLGSVTEADWGKEAHRRAWNVAIKYL